MVMKTKGIPSCTGTPGQPQIVGMFEDRSWELKLPFGISNARSAVIPWLLFLMK